MSWRHAATAPLRFPSTALLRCLTAAAQVVYVGDGNNIVHSWLRLATRLSFEFVVVCPPGYEPCQSTVEGARAAGLSSITVTSDINAVKGADVIYTDVWASMGQKETIDERKIAFAPYQVRCGPWGRGLAAGCWRWWWQGRAGDGDEGDQQGLGTEGAGQRVQPLGGMPELLPGVSEGCDPGL